MWLSRKINKKGNTPTAEKGEVTLSSPKNWEAFATQKLRNITGYSPYGFCSLAPAGTEVLLLPVSGSAAALGTKANINGLAAGEVKIYSKGGASIELKNDGTIVLNGTVKIDGKGHITGWQAN